MNKSAILVQKDGRTVKWFKVWNEENEGTIKIVFKNKDKEKIAIEKFYKQTKEKPVMLLCCEAVIKYWTKYNPQCHNLVCSSGHFHEVEKIERK